MTIQYSAEQVRTALEELGLTPDDSPESWVGASTWDNAGYVRTLELCGQMVSGLEVRKALDLRSTLPLPGAAGSLSSPHAGTATGLA